MFRIISNLPICDFVSVRKKNNEKITIYGETIEHECLDISTIFVEKKAIKKTGHKKFMKLH